MAQMESRSLSEAMDAVDHDPAVQALDQVNREREVSPDNSLVLIRPVLRLLEHLARPNPKPWPTEGTVVAPPR